MKKLILALFILCVLSASLFAAEYNYWEIKSPGTNFVRYQIADKPEGDWTIMEQDGQNIVYTGIDMSKPIYVAVSYDGENWSETTVAYPPKKASSANAISFSVAPYALQASTSSSADNAVLSDYGVGAEVSYRQYLGKGLYAEAAFGYDYFLYKDNESQHFHSALLSASFGYSFSVASKWSTEVQAGVGDDILFYGEAVSNTVTVKTGFGASYGVTENVATTLKVVGTIGFAKKAGTSYMNYHVVPMVGCCYSF